MKVSKLSFKTKRWLLLFHIIFAGIMLGNMVVFLILSIFSVTVDTPVLVNACFQAMHMLARTSVKASTIGTTITGILLSIWSNWGLSKYYWIIAKEGLTVLAIAINLWGFYDWTLDAIQVQSPGQAFIVHVELWTGIVIQILSLVLMYALSVFKPWGKRVTRKLF